MDPSNWYQAQPQHYYPYPHLPPNPSPITIADPPPPAPATSYPYDAHIAGATVAPPGVDAHAPYSYAPHGGHQGHAVPYVYPAAGEPPYYHGYGGGGDVGAFAAADAGRQYEVHPVAHADVLGRPPNVSVYQNNKPTQPSQNGILQKKKKKIPKTVQSVYCEVCKIACNSQEVLNSHRQGKKHKKNVEKLKESIAPKPAKAPTKLVENKETPKSEKDKTGGDKTKKKLAPATEADLETKRRKVLEGGAAADAVKVCTLCNVVCNSEVVFDYHVAGQKHAAMVKKQQGPAVS